MISFSTVFANSFDYRLCTHSHGLTGSSKVYDIRIPCVRKTVPWEKYTLVQFDKMVTSPTAGERQQQQIVVFPFPLLLTTNSDQYEMGHSRW
jgi:hypothetical protein